jgi:hypothetical protein
MNLDALVTKGRLPWLPSPDARDLHVWYEYEYPHVGTFMADRATVLFTVVGGIETQMSVWAYACLEPDEAGDLVGKTFATQPELRQFVQETLAGRQLVLALADDLVISNWAVSEDKGELYEVATAFLEQILAQTPSRLNPGTKFRAKLAQVDVTTHELIEA